jgi:hypothetical protein
MDTNPTPIDSSPHPLTEVDPVAKDKVGTIFGNP